MEYSMHWNIDILSYIIFYTFISNDSISDEFDKYMNHAWNFTIVIEKHDVNVIMLIYVMKDRAKKHKVIVMHIVSFQSSPWCNFEKVSVQIDAASWFRHNLSIRLKNIESEKVSSTYDGNLFIRKSSKWS